MHDELTLNQAMLSNTVETDVEQRPSERTQCSDNGTHTSEQSQLQCQNGVCRVDWKPSRTAAA